jgi:hypothetical protein
MPDIPVVTSRVETPTGSHVTTVVSMMAAAGSAAHDPWRDVSEEEAWRRIESEEGGTIVSCEGDSLTMKEIEGLLVMDGSDAVSLKVASCDLESIQLTELLRSRLTALDLASNRCTAFEAEPCCWLRALNLQGNPLEACPNFSTLPVLLSLDLSFVELGESLTAASLAPLQSLLKLSMDSCGLTSLLDTGGFPLFGRIPRLRALALVDNELADSDDGFRSGLAALAGTGQMKDLDLRENDVREAAGYRAAVLGLLPTLSSLDNQVRCMVVLGVFLCVRVLFAVCLCATVLKLVKMAACITVGCAHELTHEPALQFA